MPSVVYPVFGPIGIDQPLYSWEWTVWPKPVETPFEAKAGWALEIAPQRRHRVEVISDGARIAFEPHYLLSTWDEFVTDAAGSVKVTAYKRTFNWTFGSGPTLRRGIRETLAAMATRIRPSQPATAATLDQTVAVLDTFPDQGETPPKIVDVQSQQELDAIIATLRKAGRLREPPG
jgi:hypothetical protein